MRWPEIEELGVHVVRKTATRSHWTRLHHVRWYGLALVVNVNSLLTPFHRQRVQFHSRCQVVVRILCVPADWMRLGRRMLVLGLLDRLRSCSVLRLLDAGTVRRVLLCSQFQGYGETLLVSRSRFVCQAVLVVDLGRK